MFASSYADIMCFNMFPYTSKMFFEINAERENLKSRVRIFIARDQGHRVVMET